MSSLFDAVGIKRAYKTRRSADIHDQSALCVEGFEYELEMVIKLAEFLLSLPDPKPYLPCGIQGIIGINSWAGSINSP